MTIVKTKYIRYCLIALFLIIMVSMTGCSGSTDSIVDTGNNNIETKDNSLLIMTLDAASSTSRADYGTIDGTDSENYLSGLRIYFCDQSDVIKKVITTYDEIENPTSIVISLGKENLSFDTPYHIYIGANLPQSAKNQLTVGTNILTAVGNIAAISELTTAKHFTMFGQANHNNSAEISIKEGEVTNAVASLDRVMAKVLVTADADANGCVTDPNGWAEIKISDIQFNLLTTNKNYYFTQHLDNGIVLDPNYEMDNYLSSTTDFMNNPSSKQAQIFDKSKLDANDENYVANSIYCLGNTTNLSKQFATWTSDKQLTNLRKVVTYVHIMYKAVPKAIDGKSYAQVKLSDNSYCTYIKASTDEEKALCFSTLDNLKQKFGNGIDESYVKWHKTTDVYTYDAFVNCGNFSTTGSALLRNHYYILNIKKISTPYIEKLMEINTLVVGWAKKGRTSQEIDTSGTTN